MPGYLVSRKRRSDNMLLIYCRGTVLMLTRLSPCRTPDLPPVTPRPQTTNGGEFPRRSALMSQSPATLLAGRGALRGGPGGRRRRGHLAPPKGARLLGGCFCGFLGS